MKTIYCNAQKLFIKENTKQSKHQHQDSRQRIPIKHFWQNIVFVVRDFKIYFLFTWTNFTSKFLLKTINAFNQLISGIKVFRN
uniref:NADH-quinone oxidoreductase subunit A n=1 Tax=Flavobacterium saccharophilum TaxID=29534 RepID=UPI0037C07E83